VLLLYVLRNVVLILMSVRRVKSVAIVQVTPATAPLGGSGCLADSLAGIRRHPELEGDRRYAPVPIESLRAREVLLCADR
jgi:hypothetical protein